MLEIQKLHNEAENAIQWIRGYIQSTCAKGIVIGNSGGKDSATVLAMSTKAIGKENVVSVYMPCSSNKSDFEDAKLVAETFGVRLLNIDLNNCYEQLEIEMSSELKKIQIKELSKETKVNITYLKDKIIIEKAKQT